MSPEDMMYENKKTQMMTRMWVILAFLLGSLILGGSYLYFYRPVSPVKISADVCTRLCQENGVESFTDEACNCNKPKPPVVEKVDHMVCECRPATQFENAVRK